MYKRVIVASHRRSGTHLTIDSIVNNFHAFENAPAIPDVNLDRLSSRSKKRLSTAELSKTIESRSTLFKTHAHANLDAFFNGDEVQRRWVHDLFAESRIVYVHRDGRDVMVSLYYYERSFNEQARENTFSEYLRGTNGFDVNTYAGEMNRVEYWAFHVDSWLEQSSILLLSFGELERDYARTLQRIAEYLEEPLRSRYRDIRRADQNQLIFRAKSRLLRHIVRARYSSVNFRKGRSGDWRNHFTKDDLDYFERHGGDVNRRLGYNERPI